MLSSSQTPLLFSGFSLFPHTWRFQNSGWWKEVGVGQDGSYTCILTRLNGCEDWDKAWKRCHSISDTQIPLKNGLFCLFCFVFNDYDVLSMFPCLLWAVTHTFLAFFLPVGHVLGWEREHASLHPLRNFPQLLLGDLHRVGGACPGLAQHWC